MWLHNLHLSGLRPERSGAGSSRRRRGGLLIQVILGMLLLAVLATATYSYFRQSSARAEVMSWTSNLRLMSLEVRDAFPSPPGDRRGATDYLIARTRLDPRLYERNDVWFAGSARNYVELRIRTMSRQTCQRLAQSPALFGSHLKEITCPAGSNSSMRFQFWLKNASSNARS